MKIEFDNNGMEFVELKKTSTGIVIIISSQDLNAKNKTSIINSVELTQEEFDKLLSEVNDSDNNTT